jgi:hypothetical protein
MIHVCRALRLTGITDRIIELATLLKSFDGILTTLKFMSHQSPLLDGCLFRTWTASFGGDTPGFPKGQVKPNDYRLCAVSETETGEVCLVRCLA